MQLIHPDEYTHCPNADERDDAYMADGFRSESREINLFFDFKCDYLCIDRFTKVDVRPPRSCNYFIFDAVIRGIDEDREQYENNCCWADAIERTLSV
jgi:hypothetical protein